MAHKKTVKCRTARHHKTHHGAAATKPSVKGKARKVAVKSKVKKKAAQPKSAKTKTHLKRMRGTHKPVGCAAKAEHG